VVFYFIFISEQEKKIKPFNWQKAFPEVFKDRAEDTNIKEELKIRRLQSVRNKRIEDAL